MKYNKCLSLLSSALFCVTSNAATFYTDTNFSNSPIALYEREWYQDIPNIPISSVTSIVIKNQISSITVENKECVAAYSGENFDGRFVILSEGDYNLQLDDYLIYYRDVNQRDYSYIEMNDDIESILVFPKHGYRTCENSLGFVYENANQTGRSYPIPYAVRFPSVYWDENNFNNKASSYSLPDGLCAELTQNADWQGSAKVIKGEGNLDSWNNKLSSFFGFNENHWRCTVD